MRTHELINAYNLKKRYESQKTIVVIDLDEKLIIFNNTQILQINIRHAFFRS